MGVGVGVRSRDNQIGERAKRRWGGGWGGGVGGGMEVGVGVWGLRL